MLSRKLTLRTRKLRYSEATRQKLLDAAGHVFAERGYYSATIRTKFASGRVQMSRRGIITSKTSSDSTARSWAHAPAPLTWSRCAPALDQSGSPEKVLREVIRARVRGLANDGLPMVLSVICREIAQPTPALARMINKVARPIYERMLGLIGRIIGLAAEDEKKRGCVLTASWGRFFSMPLRSLAGAAFTEYRADSGAAGSHRRSHCRFFHSLIFTRSDRARQAWQWHK